MSTASEPLNSFIIVIYDPCPTYSFLLFFHDCAFRNGGIDHFTDFMILQILTKYLNKLGRSKL